MNYENIKIMIKSIENGIDVKRDILIKSIEYVIDNKDCRLATDLAYCFGESSENTYVWALERFLSFDFCPASSAQAIKFLCRKGFFEKYRDLILEWAAVSPSRKNNTSKKSMATFMIGEYLHEHKDKYLRDFVAKKVELYLKSDDYELSSYECSEKHDFQQAAATAMGADMKEIRLCDDIDHSDRLEEYWAKRFLAERIDG